MAGGIDRASGPAATILVNGRITTGLEGGDGGAGASGDGGGDGATALAIRGGRVLSTGGDDEVRLTAGPATTVIDLGGRRVVPGLIDSHIHAVRAGLTWTERLDWSGVPTLAEALASIEAAARERPGAWVAVVGGWHPGQFAEGRGPTPAELTAAAPANPVYVQLLYEEAALNEAGLAACGVRVGELDPAGAWFERDGSGRPTGYARSRSAFRHCLRVIGEPPFERQVASTEAFLLRLSAAGITGVVDPGGGNLAPDAYRAIFELWRRRPLPVRVRLYVSNSGVEPGRELAQTREYVRHLHPGFGDDHLRFVGLGEKLVNAYGDGEGMEPITVAEEDRAALRDVTRCLVEYGWPAHVHAIRDATVGAVLDVWEEIDAETPLAGRRFSIAHADAVSERNLRRIQRLGIGIAVQDRLVFRAADSERAWGPGSMLDAPPLRRMLDLGIPVGAGTDATAVTSYDPWLSIWWLVTGRSLDGAAARRTEHRLTRAEALRLYTAGSAWFSFDEHQRGALAPGMLADLAVLSQDYFAVPDDEIPRIESVLTIVGGVPVHVAQGVARANAAAFSRTHWAKVRAGSPVTCSTVGRTV